MDGAPLERYVLERGEYVLYIGRARAFSTPTVAVLIDTRLRRLVTHGDPPTVRLEVDRLRAMQPPTSAAPHDQEWLLLEGRPRIDALNRALHDVTDMQSVNEAFASAAERDAMVMARLLIARASRRW